MKNSILNLVGVQELSAQEKKQINAGQTQDWDRCCLKEDSTDIPFGCEAFLICDGFIN